MGRRAETVQPLRHVSENPTTCVPHRYGVPCARRMVPLESPVPEIGPPGSVSGGTGNAVTGAGLRPGRKATELPPDL